jgi:hypothetical protein
MAERKRVVAERQRAVVEAWAGVVARVEEVLDGRASRSDVGSALEEALSGLVAAAVRLGSVGSGGWEGGGRGRGTPDTGGSEKTG